MLKSAALQAVDAEFSHSLCRLAVRIYHLCRLIPAGSRPTKMLLGRRLQQRARVALQTRKFGALHCAVTVALSISFRRQLEHI